MWNKAILPHLLLRQRRKRQPVRKILTRERNWQDKIDDLLTGPWLGIPIFAIVMFLVFYISQSTLGTWIADWLVGWIETFQEWVAGLVENANPFLQSLLVDGIIGGVGAVVGFLPLIMVMYFLIALLEDCGYMARATEVQIKQPFWYIRSGRLSPRAVREQALYRDSLLWRQWQWW